MAHLVVLNGSLRDHRWVADRRLTIGRHQDNCVQLPGGLVSRFHAVLDVASDGSFWLEDHGSTAGTMVNGERVTRRRLHHGDELTIGDVLLRFEEAEEVEDLGATMEATKPMDQDTPLRFGARAGTVQQVYDEVLEYLLSIVPAQRGVILLLQPGGAPAPVAERLTGPAMNPMITGIDQGQVQRAMSGKEPVFVPSRIRGGDLDIRDAIQLGDTRCSIVAPLLAVDGAAMGVVYLDSWDVFHQLDRRQVPWIADAAAPAARAIERFAAQATFTKEGS